MKGLRPRSSSTKNRNVSDDRVKGFKCCIDVNSDTFEQ